MTMIPPGFRKPVDKHGNNSLLTFIYNFISSVILRGKCFFCTLFLLVVALSYSCNDPDDIGMNVLPPGDQLELISSDTATILTKIEPDDSLRGDELSRQLLGSIYDPVFGNHQAAVYSQVLLAGIPNFTIYTRCDSLVLALKYKGYYGDTSVTQQVKVYRLTGDLYTDSSYYSDKSFSYDPSPLADYSFNPSPNSLTTVGTDSNAVPQLRIPLTASLGDSIMAMNGQVTLSNNNDWKTYFHGILIRIDPTFSGRGCISYFDFANSSMVLYFHDTLNTVKNYSFTLNGARLNSFQHDYLGSDVGRQFADSAYMDTLTYIQAMGGVKTRISFPFLKHFTDSGSIVVNKAQLVLTPQPTNSLDYPLPESLLALAIDSAGAVHAPEDLILEPGGFYGGIYNSSTNTYTFNLPRHIQSILNGHTDNAGMYIVVSGSGISANRVVLGSGKNPSYRMKLVLYYTRIP